MHSEWDLCEKSEDLVIKLPFVHCCKNTHINIFKGKTLHFNWKNKTRTTGNYWKNSVWVKLKSLTDGV